MVFQPLFDHIGMMNTQVIKNQKDFLGCIFDKPLHELEKRLCVHGVFIDHKANFSLKEKVDQRVRVEGRIRSKYSTGDVLVSCLYGMFLGYPRPGQIEVFTSDRVFQRVADLVSFPVQSTISRFLSSLKVTVAREVAKLNFDFLMKLRGNFKGWKSITLDLDSHVTPVFTGISNGPGLGTTPKRREERAIIPFCALSVRPEITWEVFSEAASIIHLIMPLSFSKASPRDCLLILRI